MKRYFAVLACAMLSLCVMAEPFGIMVNGTDAHVGAKNQSPMDPSFQEYYVLNLPLKAGDFVQLYDADGMATWAVDVDQASVAGFTRNGDKINCTQDGCYDFYIKLKFGEDQLYIGAGNCDNTGGGEPNPGDGDGNPRYYYKGYIDGQDVEPEDIDNRFYDGMATLEVKQAAYIFVLYQVDGQPGQQYMATAYSTDSHCTMSTTGGEKLGITTPGTYTLYLYDNENGTLELSTVELPGKKLVQADTTGLEGVDVQKLATKVIENGHLYIIRAGVRYDMTGNVVR